jgi:DedD protein
MEKEDLLNIKPKKNRKKPLIYGAVAFLIFIIVVIVYAIYSNSKEENVVLPPQVNESPKEKNSGFQEVPIEDANTLSQKINSNSSNKSVLVNENLNDNDLNNSINDETDKEDIIKEEKKEKPVEKKDFSKKNKIKEVTKKEKQHKKNRIKKIKKYYIQVAALMKYKPDKKFLNLIKREGFNYTFYHTYIIKNNQKIPVTKVLIGPFDNERIARKKLRIIKEKITQNAFIFKVK